MVELGTLDACIPDRTRRKQSDTKSQRAQQCGERAVQFVAEAATALLDNFAKKGFFSYDNLASAGNIKVLERDRHHVSAMNTAQRFGNGCGRTLIADAGEIGVYIEHVCRLSEMGKQKSCLAAMFLKFFAELSGQQRFFPLCFDPKAENDDADSNHASPAVYCKRRANRGQIQP